MSLILPSITRQELFDAYYAGWEGAKFNVKENDYHYKQLRESYNRGVEAKKIFKLKEAQAEKFVDKKVSNDIISSGAK